MKHILINYIIYISIYIVLSDDKYFIRINKDTNNEYYFELKETEAAKQFKEKLPFTVKMTNFNQNEVYYEFSDDFKKNEKSVGRNNIGDIHLYKSNTLVLFYKTFDTTYKYTEIGKLLNTNNLEKVIGTNDVLVQWCLNTCVDDELSFSYVKLNYLILFSLIILIL